MELTIIHFGDICGWGYYEHQDSFSIHQANYRKLNEITFYPYCETGVKEKVFNDTVAIFRIKRKWTNMMIADDIINGSLKNLAI